MHATVSDGGIFINLERCLPRYNGTLIRIILILDKPRNRTVIKFRLASLSLTDFGAGLCCLGVRYWTGSML